MNWIKDLSKKLRISFFALREDVSGDLKTINLELTGENDAKLTVTDEDHHVFSVVIRPVQHLDHKVTFRIDGPWISCSETIGFIGISLFRFQPCLEHSIDAAGAIRFEIEDDDRVFESWQIRKRALQQVIFSLNQVGLSLAAAGGLQDEKGEPAA